MKKIILILLLLYSPPVFANQYGLYTPESYTKGFQPQESERILFIMDFSNSMTEPLEGSTKVDLMLRTMQEILPKINPNTWVGLRIYGHKMGFTPIEACKASSLVAPIDRNNSGYIENALFRTRPKGMTPITYSLKQAIKYDFMGLTAKSILF